MDQPTIEAYNRQAKAYDDQTADFWELFPRAFFDKFIDSVAGSKVLDVGSGPGREGLILRQRGLDVTCLDASETMVQLCRAKGLEAIEADFCHMPFPDGSFNGVWAYTSLLHVPKTDIAQPLREIFRVLKPGGVFGLGLIEGATEGYIQGTKITKPRWFSYYGKREVELILDAHGFEVGHFATFNPGKHNYLNFIARKAASGKK